MAVEDVAEKAQILLGRVDLYSAGTASGSKEDAFSFLYTFVPRGPDDGPEIPVSFEILGMLTPRQRLAIDLAHSYFGTFNRELGIGSNVGENLTLENEALRDFFESIGRMVQGMLHPGGRYGRAEDCLVNLLRVNESYHRLIIWANSQV